MEKAPSSTQFKALGPEAVARSMKGRTAEEIVNFIKGSNSRFLTQSQTSDINVERRSVKLSFSSTSPVLRWFGYEVLSHEPNAMDTARIKAAGPLLLNHDWDQQIGVVEDAWLEGNRGHAIVRFSRSALAEEIFQDVVDGIRSSISFFYTIEDMALQSRGGDEPDTYLLSKWTPVEISIVSVPADTSVGVGRSYEEFQSTVSTSKETVMPQGNGESKVESTQVRAAGEADTSRVRELYALAREHGGLDEVEAFIDDRKSPADFSRHLLGKKNPKPITPKDNALGLSDKEVREFSFIRALNALASGDMRGAEYEFEVSEAAKKKFKRDSSFIIPTDVLRAPSARFMGAQNTSNPTYLVPTDVLSFIDMLRNNLVTRQLGARMLTGLSGNVSIPGIKTGSNAHWVDEGQEPPESSFTHRQVPLSPRSLSTYVDVTRKLLIQAGNIDVEQFIRFDLSYAIANALDKSILFGPEDGAEKGPKGIIQQAEESGTGVHVFDQANANIDWTKIVAMETAVAESNANAGSLAYVLSPALKGFMKTKAKTDGVPGYLWGSDDTINGYKAIATNNIPKKVGAGQAPASTYMIYGDFSSVVIGEFGPGLDVQVNPYIKGTAGIVRVRVLTELDHGLRHQESFSVVKGIKV